MDLSTEKLALELGIALAPLGELTKSENAPALIEFLGRRFPPELFAHVQVKAAFDSAAASMAIALDRWEELDDALSQGLPSAAASARAVLAALAVFVADLRRLSPALTVAADTLPAATADKVRAFAGAQPERRILDYAVILDLERRRRPLLGILVIARIADRAAQARDTADDTSVDFILRRLNLGELWKTLTDPVGSLRDRFGWGGTPQRRLLLDTLAFAFDVVGLDATVTEDPSGTVTLSSHMVDVTWGGTSAGLSLLVHAGFDGGFVEEIPLGAGRTLVLSAEAELPVTSTVNLRPPAEVEVIPSVGAMSGRVSAEVRRAPVAPSTTVLFLGDADGSRVEAAAATTSLAALLSWNGSVARVDLEAALALTGGQVTVDLSGGDSFLSKLFAGAPLRGNFQFRLAWRPDRGVRFDGAGGLQLVLPINVAIGPVTFSSIRVALAGGTEKVALSVLANAAASLGPVRAEVEDVGAGLELDFRSGEADAGPFGVQAGFQAPRGVAIGVEAGPVAGGGFLFFDPDQRRYGGALTLRIYEIEVSAFGIIETVLPGGQPGFSFAILISARFTPIPIGLGFTLNGVGGLLGINRTVDTQALQDTVRTHTLDNVLFPEAPENNALEILGSLRALFPAAEGRFAFGPMAIIGWGGTIPVLEAEIGLILELPEPIRLTILGQVRAGLPDKDKAFVKLNFDAVGVLDFERKTFSLDASLYESNVGGFPISGDMALRLNWGSPPNFVLSIGGFHPQFQPPPGIPVLARVQVALGQNGNPRITIQGYLAITSNTAQIGARAEVLAFKGSFSLLGWIGFDALFTFQPFTFKADFSAGVALRKGSRHIASIRLHGTLTGPNPWHVSGEACLSLWFFDICIGFSVPLSDRKPEALQPAPAIAPRLRDALADLRNWSAELPAGAHQAVSLLVSPEARPAVLVDPLGGLSVRQRVVPLDVRITRFENIKLAKNAQPRFTIGAVTLGAGAGSSSASVGKVSDFFARAQFEDMSDAKKLSLPAFEALTSGVSVQSAALDTRGRVDCEVTYETSVLDAPDAADEPGSSYIPLGSRLDKLARLSGSGLGGLRAVGPDQFGSRFTVLRTDLSPEPFTVAGVGGLVARPELVADVKQRLGFVSKANAQRILEQHLENNPADRGTLQVVPELELPRAA